MSQFRRGNIVGIDHRFFAKVVFPDGQFSLVEPLGADLEIGDVISGNLWSLGGEELFNETKGERFSAFIQDHS